MVIKLDSIESDFETISVFKRRSTGAITYKQGGCCQSESDSNGTSVASYIHAIFGSAAQAKVRKILLIGCGGRNIGHDAGAQRPRGYYCRRQLRIFRRRKLYFELPENVVCHVADGKSHLRSDAHNHDAVVLDAFHGDRIPFHLHSLRFYNLVRDRP